MLLAVAVVMHRFASELRPSKEAKSRAADSSMAEGVQGSGSSDSQAPEGE